jgi:hypothetical protein
VRRDVHGPEQVRALLESLPTSPLKEWTTEQRRSLGAVLAAVPDELLPRAFEGDRSPLRATGEKLLDSRWRGDTDAQVDVERLLDRVRRAVVGDPVARRESLHDDLAAALGGMPADAPSADVRTAALLAESIDQGVLPDAARRIAVLPRIADSAAGRVLLLERMAGDVPRVDPDVAAEQALRHMDAALAETADTAIGGGTAAYAWVGRAGDQLFAASVDLADAAPEFAALDDAYAAGLASDTAAAMASLSSDMRRAARTASESQMPQLGQVGRARATLTTLLDVRELQAQFAAASGAAPNTI